MWVYISVLLCDRGRNVGLYLSAVWQLCEICGFISQCCCVTGEEMWVYISVLLCGKGKRCGFVSQCYCVTVVRDVGLYLSAAVWQGEERAVKQFMFKPWPDYQALPNSGTSLLRLHRMVTDWYKQNGKGPVTIHCMSVSLYTSSLLISCGLFPKSTQRSGSNLDL